MYTKVSLDWPLRLSYDGRRGIFMLKSYASMRKNPYGERASLLL